MKRAFFLVPLLVFAFSCSEHNSPTEPSLSGYVSAKIIEAGTNVGVAGARVEVRLRDGGPVEYSGVTDANGVAIVAVPRNVRLWVMIVPPAGYAWPAGTPIGSGVAGMAGMSITISLARVTVP